VELRQLRRVLGSAMANASLTATIDKKIILKTPSNTKSPSANGSWNAQGGGKYTLNINEGGKNYEIQAFAEGNKLVVNREGYSLVFEK
jgi:septal ring-binding cell division protein DamX